MKRRKKGKKDGSVLAAEQQSRGGRGKGAIDTAESESEELGCEHEGGEYGSERRSSD